MSEYMKHMMEIEAVKKEADKLMMDKIVYYEKEIDLVREEAQVTQLQLEKKIQQKDDRIRELEQINKEHQTLNGKLREEIKSIEIGTVNNFRRKGVL
jgi:TolA-binding protein